MSIPAVLYDFVPVDYPTEEESPNVSFFVSSVVHEASAPLEEFDDSGNSIPHSGQSGLLTNTNGTSESTNGISTEDDEDHDNTMETIIDEIDSDYVLIPIASSTAPTDHDSRSMSAISQRIKVYNKVLRKAVSKLSKSNLDGARALRKTNDVVVKFLSTCATGPIALISKPFEFHSWEMMSFSIYRSYDSASETIIDDFGNRLVLPGSCVALDSDSSHKGITDGEEQNSYGNRNSGTRIGSESRGPNSTPPSSLWSSKTIMVSAHDLLAVKHDKRMKVGNEEVRRPSYLCGKLAEEENGEPHCDRTYYNSNGYDTSYSTVTVTTTQNIIQQWTRALWMFAQRNARVWYCLSQTYSRRSLRNARHLLVNSQHVLIKHYKSRNVSFHGTLPVSYNACYYDYNNRNHEQEIALKMLVDKSGKTSSHHSLNDRQSNEKNDNGCSTTAYGSDWNLIDIEMTTPALTQKCGSE